VVETEGVYLGEGGLSVEEVRDNWGKITETSNSQAYFMGGEQSAKFFRKMTEAEPAPRRITPNACTGKRKRALIAASGPPLRSPRGGMSMKLAAAVPALIWATASVLALPALAADYKPR
jgi:hypothetical protein